MTCDSSVAIRTMSTTTTRPVEPGPTSPRRSQLPKHIHLVGAGGAGLSGTAKLLAEDGHVISAHDRARSRFTDEISNRGIRVALGVSAASHLPESAELVVRSAAVPDEDPQVVAAKQRGIPVMKYAQVLALLAPAGRTLAIAGTHGKTTTSWMVHHALRGAATAGFLASPGALVGGVDRSLRTNAISRDPKGGWFAVEACEYDRSFLHLAPTGAIVTNLEEDHLDYYGTIGALREAFATFAGNVAPNGLLVLGRDVPAEVESAARCTVWRKGREFDIESTRETHGYFHLRVRGPGFLSPIVRLSVPGSFNMENAACALALVCGVAASEPQRDEFAARAGDGLRGFLGVERRFEPWGLHGGVEVVHDYAHHPTEVSATMRAARRALPGKPLNVLFQPHQESRTARFMTEFAQSLSGAESVVVADVYGARKHIDTQSAGSPELAARLREKGIDAVHGGDLASSTRLFLQRLRGGSGALVLGAGDVDLIRDDLIHALALRSPAAGRAPR